MMGGMMGGFGTGWGGFGGFGLVGLILNLALTVGLIVGLVLLIAWLWRRVVSDGQGTAIPRSSASSGTSAKEILQIRYAQGEISREQYQQMLADLSG